MSVIITSIYSSFDVLLETLIFIIPYMISAIIYRQLDVGVFEKSNQNLLLLAGSLIISLIEFEYLNS